MKWVIDDKIPYISSFFTQDDDIVYLPGEKITNNDLRDADALITRTITKVDVQLLKNTCVKFVGTATTGTDHIDTKWLAKNNIMLATAAGANSQAVAEYVLCCLAALYKQDLLCDKKVVGIIGCGRIGSLVAKLFQTLRFEVICCDPLLIEKNDFHFVSLDTLLSESDIISIHTPLTFSTDIQNTGKWERQRPRGYSQSNTVKSHSTFHLINDISIKKINPKAILINTARGEVIDQQALLQTKNRIFCLDVWNNEPHICLELLHKVFIGTPHIAGYSLDAKYRATEIIYAHAAEFFGWHNDAMHCSSHLNANKMTLTSDWIKKALSIYDPLQHTAQFRKAFLSCKTSEEITHAFTTERKNYPLREGLI